MAATCRRLGTIPRLQKRQRQILGRDCRTRCTYCIPRGRPLTSSSEKAIRMRHSDFHSPSSFPLLFFAGLAFTAPPQTATPAVEKMTCGTGPVVVKKALTQVPAVSSTTIDMDTGTATVTFDPDQPQPHGFPRRRPRQSAPRSSSSNRDRRYFRVHADLPELRASATGDNADGAHASIFTSARIAHPAKNLDCAWVCFVVIVLHACHLDQGCMTALRLEELVF